MRVRKPMRRRRGFTLIELLVAMSLFAVIVSMAGGMVYLLLARRPPAQTPFPMQ